MHNYSTSNSKTAVTLLLWKSLHAELKTSGPKSANYLCTFLVSLWLHKHTCITDWGLRGKVKEGRRKEIQYLTVITNCHIFLAMSNWLLSDLDRISSLCIHFLDSDKISIKDKLSLKESRCNHTQVYALFLPCTPLPTSTTYRTELPWHFQVKFAGLAFIRYYYREDYENQLQVVFF